MNTEKVYVLGSWYRTDKVLKAILSKVWLNGEAGALEMEARIAVTCGRLIPE